eukprot:GEZU01002038.1.p1 GENE.GEZU01002038.1~~GEZU01002038.1.p1  ORF type:complete len:1006 (+),score=425.20 GEZU01002038.1:121-3138(+)
MATDHINVDTKLYDRQIYAIGLDAMKRISTSRVLIVGLGGVGVEIAKNVILTGVKHVTLYDPKPVSWNDFSSQFYLKESSLGKNRVAESISQLKELNKYVEVVQHTGELTNDFITSFNVVVFTDSHIPHLIDINKECHQKGTKFIAVESRGVFGSVFVDFGKDFEISDPDGEAPIQRIVTNITREENATVSVHDDERHGFQDGDQVIFSDVKGMEELNGQIREIKVTGPYNFTIGDTSKFSEYVRGGYVKQVKSKKLMSFDTLEDSIKNPEFILTDFGKFDRPPQLHLAFRALAEFAKQRGDILPRPYNAQDADEFISIARKLNTDNIEVSDDLLRKFAFTAAGNLNPMAAFLGGFAAQEVQKAVSGKFTPLKQWLYFDFVEALPDPLPSEEEVQPVGSRYDGQIVVFGKKFQEVLGNTRQFIVGAGALGCEFLKNFAMMGIGCGKNGLVHVTDMDMIEISNLSRQFLFRQHHVSKLKSETAAAVVKEMNPEFKVISLNEKVGKDTEDIFDDDFWEALDGVTNALDNIQARLYVDTRCVYYRKPLLESGTLGTKGNVQVVVPGVTESYGQSRDPPEKSIPSCTLKNFPSMIEHCIAWSKDLFGGMFGNAAEEVNSFLTNPDFINSIEGSKRATVEAIHDNLIASKPRSFDDCIVWARLKFEDFYNHKIRQLLSMFPLDAKTSTGAPFWSGPKRPPRPLEFDPNDPLHMGYIIAAANLRAFNYNIPGRADPEYFKPILASVMVPEFTFNAKIKINVDEKAAEEQPTFSEDDEGVVNRLLGELEKRRDEFKDFRMTPIELEKDDDTNHHIDFITAASNLRARNYQIPEADRHTTKGIAGQIIPAMVTTTALITGLVCVELYKLRLGKTKIEDYRNAFVNIALPFVTLSEPIAPAKSKYYDVEWSQWDRFDVDLGQDVTLGEFLDYFKKEHKLEVTMVSCGVSSIYAFFMNPATIKQRKAMKMSDVVKQVSKQDFPPKQKYLNLEILCNNEEGDDVDVPPVRYKFRAF